MYFQDKTRQAGKRVCYLYSKVLLIFVVLGILFTSINHAYTHASSLYPQDALRLSTMDIPHAHEADQESQDVLLHVLTHKHHSTGAVDHDHSSYASDSSETYAAVDSVGIVYFQHMETYARSPFYRHFKPPRDVI